MESKRGRVRVTGGMEGEEGDRREGRVRVTGGERR